VLNTVTNSGPRRGFVGVRLSPEGRTAVQSIADAEHSGNLSEAIRALLAEALAQRQRRKPARSHAGDSVTA
jgi:hypothetical protein